MVAFGWFMWEKAFVDANIGPEVEQKVFIFGGLICKKNADYYWKCFSCKECQHHPESAICKHYCLGIGQQQKNIGSRVLRSTTDKPSNSSKRLIMLFY